MSPQGGASRGWCKRWRCSNQIGGVARLDFLSITKAPCFFSFNQLQLFGFVESFDPVYDLRPVDRCLQLRLQLLPLFSTTSAPSQSRLLFSTFFFAIRQKGKNMMEKQPAIPDCSSSARPSLDLLTPPPFLPARRQNETTS
jgi:hypothetical protein